MDESPRRQPQESWEKARNFVVIVEIVQVGTAAGRITRNVLPAPGAVVSSTRPPCATARSPRRSRGRVRRRRAADRGCARPGTAVRRRAAPPRPTCPVRCRSLPAPRPAYRGSSSRPTRRGRWHGRVRVSRPPDPHHHACVVAGVLQRVADQVRRDLPQPIVIAETVTGSNVSNASSSAANCTNRVGTRTCASRTVSAATPSRSTGRLPHRPLLVEPGQLQKIIDEYAHPDDLALDPAHRLVEFRAGRRAAATVELGEALDRRQRRTQLVRRIREELAQPLLRGGPRRRAPPRSGPASR